MQKEITQTFYAKWILPLVLLILGVVCILVFYTSTAFVKDTNGNIYYLVEDDTYVNIEDKYYYDYEIKGSKEIYTKTDKLYEGELPKYKQWKYNMSGIGTASGIALCSIGLFMYVINTVKKISEGRNRDFDDEDEEDES